MEQFEHPISASDKICKILDELDNQQVKLACKPPHQFSTKYEKGQNIKERVYCRLVAFKFERVLPIRLKLGIDPITNLKTPIIPTLVSLKLHPSLSLH